MKSKVSESVYGCNFGLLSICVVRVKYWGDRYIINILISVLLVPNGTQIFRILFPKNILPDKAFTSSILSRWLGVTSIICRFLKWVCPLMNALNTLSSKQIWVLNYLPVWEEIYKLYLVSHDGVKIGLSNFVWCCLCCNVFWISLSRKLILPNCPLEMCELAVVDMMAWETYKIFFHVVSIIDTETTAHRSIAPF